MLTLSPMFCIMPNQCKPYIVAWLYCCHVLLRGRGGGTCHRRHEIFDKKDPIVWCCREILQHTDSNIKISQTVNDFKSLFSWRPGDLMPYDSISDHNAAHPKINVPVAHDMLQVLNTYSIRYKRNFLSLTTQNTFQCYLWAWSVRSNLH